MSRLHPTVPLPIPPESLLGNDSAPQLGRSVRALDAAAGLLSAGVLLVGLMLLGSKLLAPGLLGGTGLERAEGPRWWRIVVQLAVGAAGEAVRLLLRGPARRMPVAVRVAVDLLVVLACLAALWLTWWR